MKRRRLAILLALGAGLRCSEAAAQEVDHSQMDHAHADQAQVARGPTGIDAPRTPIPLLTDADRTAAQAPALQHLHQDDGIYSRTLVERMETWNADHGAGLGWEAGGWIGGDINRLWWRTQGERIDGHTGDADFELMFGHSFSPRWNWLAGLRQDLRPRAARSFLAFGVQGLAPQWFDVSATAYLGEEGRTAARLSAEYSLLLTNRLVLQPLAELNLYGKNDPSRGIGSGLSTAEFGLRLRFEFTRQFAPYLGISWERAVGDTARLRRAAGNGASDMRWLAGLRMWF